MEDAVLVNARGQPLLKNSAIDHSNATSLFQPSRMFAVGRHDLHGATPNPRRRDFKLYIDMFMAHPILKAAIEKKIMVATNTGFEFVPRNRRMKEVPKEQAEIASEFFDSQPNFLNELRQIYLDLELFGDAFFYIVPDRKRRPKRLKRLSPWTVNIKAKKSGEVELYVQTVGNETRTFKPHELIHFRHVHPDDELYGLSRLEALKKTVNSDLLAEMYNLNFFENGAATGTMFAIKNATQAELELNRRWLKEEYTSTSNAHKPIILAGDVSVEKSVASHQDMGFLEGRRDNMRAILAAVDVPPAKIGDMETANRSNSKEQDKSFRTEAVMPLQYIMEAGLSNFVRDILGCPDVLFKHSEGDIRDAQEQMDLWVQAARMGFMSINEVRARMGMIEITGGDIHYVMTPTGAVPVVDLELYFSLAAGNADQGYDAMRERHDDADPAMYEVGPKPSSSDGAIVTGTPPASKSQKLPPFALANALNAVAKAGEDDVALRHCLAYSTDAYDELQHPLLDEVVKALRKARTLSDDMEMRQTYVERASAYLHTLKGQF